jgi:hypothetical protein
MPNLQPDTSIYANVGKSQGQMSPLDLMALITRMREFQGSQNLSNAVTNPANMMPGASGVLDPQAASRDYSAGGYVSPDHLQQIWALANEQAKTRRDQMIAADNLVASMYTMPAGQRAKKWAQISPQLKKWGVPSDMINAAGERLDNNSLAAIHNWTHDNAGLTMKEGVMTKEGGTEARPAGSILFDETTGGGVGVPGGGGGAGASPSKTPGSYTTNLPTGTAFPREAAAKDSAEFQAGGKGWMLQQGNLENLRDLSHDIDISGPTAEMEKSYNQLVQRFGLPGLGTVTKDDLAKTEEFDKIREQIAGQQAAVLHATDAGLLNQYGANPNLTMSKKGREANTNMLLGNNDAIRTAIGLWQKTRNTNGSATGMPKPGGGMWLDQDYYDWLSMLNKSFSPRPFQFARMRPEDQKDFKAMIERSGKGAITKFNADMKAYERNGWLDAGSASQ